MVRHRRGKVLWGRAFDMNQSTGAARRNGSVRKMRALPTPGRELIPLHPTKNISQNKELRRFFSSQLLFFT